MSLMVSLVSFTRHAIEVNKRDYRAWYGLGQTYEILKLHFYCLYYYRRAHQLRCVASAVANWPAVGFGLSHFRYCCATRKSDPSLLVAE